MGPRENTLIQRKRQSIEEKDRDTEQRDRKIVKGIDEQR